MDNIVGSSYYWCWLEPKYVCPDIANGYLVTEAILDFKNSGDWEYNKDGRGQWDDDAQLYETNCYYLVDSTLKKLGYDGLGTWWVERSNTMNTEWFCKVDLQDAQPGDIILFAGFDSEGSGNPTRNIGHIAFIADTPKMVNGQWTGSDFGAQNDTDQIDFVRWVMNNSDQYVYGIYRPKTKVWELQCLGFPDPPKNAPSPPPLDPLILDLDGNGIQTLGTSAGIHFDTDNNGFNELTGWVAPGDGMLMLDKNGNGRLDDGSELFGDFTILPNGTRAANGFQALAYYDTNHDGKIDANDPIWSQLRVWQYNDVLLSSDLSEDDPNSASATGQRYFVSQDASGCG